MVTLGTVFSGIVESAITAELVEEPSWNVEYSLGMRNSRGIFSWNEEVVCFVEDSSWNEEFKVSDPNPSNYTI